MASSVPCARHAPASPALTLHSGGEFLGGGSETEAALANGTLKAKLTAAGVTLKK